MRKKIVYLIILITVSSSYLASLEAKVDFSQERIEQLKNGGGYGGGRARYFVSGHPIDGSFTVHGTDNLFVEDTEFIQTDSKEIYITPKYMKQRLYEVNEAINKKIDKYRSDIQKSQSNQKQRIKYEDKIAKLEMDLIKSREFDTSDDVLILMYNGRGTIFYDHSLIDNQGDVVCKPLTKKFYKLTKDEKKYLKKVHGYLGIAPFAPVAFSVTYDKKCFLKEIEMKEKFIYKSNKYDKFFSHSYKLDTRSIQFIKQDMG